ncbi:uncharacterized protein LOC129286507 [Prosopis cineraria]|uniref:uncharacterized protein LOC129286507 n=1 Tax=Prosopis cineraria TaxID=364024 RepID=UPI002410841D|nr:uncharacterized protein LOC129286507 [Prosopis cineraria]
MAEHSIEIFEEAVALSEELHKEFKVTHDDIEVREQRNDFAKPNGNVNGIDSTLDELNNELALFHRIQDAMAKNFHELREFITVIEETLANNEEDEQHEVMKDSRLYILELLLIDSELPPKIIHHTRPTFLALRDNVAKHGILDSLNGLAQKDSLNCRIREPTRDAEGQAFERIRLRGTEAHSRLFALSLSTDVLIKIRVFSIKLSFQRGVTVEGRFLKRSNRLPKSNRLQHIFRSSLVQRGSTLFLNKLAKTLQYSSDPQLDLVIFMVYEIDRSDVWKQMGRCVVEFAKQRKSNHNRDEIVHLGETARSGLMKLDAMHLDKQNAHGTSLLSDESFAV